MGWQSYILLFKNKEEENRIISVIKEHNTIKDETVGETLIACVIVKLLKTKPKKLFEYDKAILCGNGGGRSSTFEWFYSNKVLLVPFTNQKWLSKEKENIKELEEEEEEEEDILFQCNKCFDVSHISNYNKNKNCCKLCSDSQ